MARDPQPLDVVREKVRSTNERTRIIALQHASAHGSAARPLVHEVIRLFEDPARAVQQMAVSTFERIGVGAAEAAPALLDLLDRTSGGWAWNQVARSFIAIGPAGRTALPKLKECYRTASRKHLLLEAMVKMDPLDTDVVQFVLEAAFSADVSLNVTGFVALRNMDGVAIDLAFERIREGARASDANARVEAARVLRAIAEKRPAEAEALIAPFLEDRTSPEAHAALGALTKLPRPLPTHLVQRAIETVAQHPRSGSRKYAISVLDEIGGEATNAGPVLLQIIKDNTSAPTVPGEPGWPAGELSRAAKALARHFPTEEAVAPLLDWLSGVSKRPRSEHVDFEDKVLWSHVGDVVTALSQLAPQSTEVHAAILAAVASSRSDLNSDPNGVLNFHRRVGEALATLPNPTELITRATGLGMSLAGPSNEHASPDESYDLPPLSADDAFEASGPAHLTEAMDRAAHAERARLVGVGQGYLGLAPGAKPRETAEAVNAWVTRAIFAGDDAAIEKALEIGLVLGESLQRITGWDWRWYQFGEQMEPALVSRDEAYLQLPTLMIARQLLLKKEVTVLALFTLLEASLLPPSRPGAFKSLS